MKYEEAHIEDMLRRFMKGETTLEEERRLADYFASAPSVPHRWRAFAVLFAGIDGGALESAGPAQPVEKPGRRRVWLKVAGVAGVAAVLCLCYVLGSVAWHADEPAIDANAVMATATAERPSAPASDHQPTAFSASPASPTTAPQAAIPPQTSSHARHKRALARHTEEASHKQDQAQLAQNEPQPKPQSEWQREAPSAPLSDSDASDLTDHIVSAAFTYSEHSQLDERAIRGRDRVRARVMEQYAHLGL